MHFLHRASSNAKGKVVWTLIVMAEQIWRYQPMYISISTMNANKRQRKKMELLRMDNLGTNATFAKDRERRQTEQNTHRIKLKRWQTVKEGEITKYTCKSIHLQDVFLAVRFFWFVLAWPQSYGNWIYICFYNHYLSPSTLFSTTSIHETVYKA